MRVVLPNAHAYVKAAAAAGGYTLFSTEHCCVCGARIMNIGNTEKPRKWLLLARASDGSEEYAVAHPNDTTPEERRAGLWVAPIGGNCLRKNPQLNFAVIGDR